VSYAFLVGEVKFGVQSRFCSGKWNACADKQDECTSIKGNSALPFLSTSNLIKKDIVFVSGSLSLL
jgi:hypothetical protein